jgi:hypothetical protein
MKKMKPTMGLAALLILGGCAGAPPHNTEVEAAAIRTAEQAFHECGISKAAEIDDKISDASTIALALVYRCGREYNAVTTAVNATLDNDNQRRIMKRRRDDQAERMETGLLYVLANRKEQIKR